MISMTEAKRIAGEWHGGQASALYGFASYSGEQSVENLEAALLEVRREIIWNTDVASNEDPEGDNDRDLYQLEQFLAQEIHLRTL